MNTELTCWPYISSCDSALSLVGVGEELILVTRPGIYSDSSYPGYVHVTVVAATLSCPDCYDYEFEPTSTLPSGVAMIPQCDVLHVVCSTEAREFLVCGDITITAGTGETDITGGSGILAPEGVLHFWSETLDVTIENNTVRIESPAEYYIN